MPQQQYMQIAIALAKQGVGWVSPNPLVGAVIVKDNQIIGQGYHARYGEQHAERNALDSCTESPTGATIYVTLEPCCHQGKQPPCTDGLIEAGITRVVIGSKDPNPLVSGKGAQILQKQGIEVIQDYMKEECDALNPIFFHYIRTGLPYVTMKYAMTRDGKIATSTGASQWITGEKARLQVQRDRHAHRGIMVGIGTVLADDPLLTCRLPQGRSPIRIICDTSLQTPLDSQIVQTSRQYPTIIATSRNDHIKQNAYRNFGCEILEVDLIDGHLDLIDLLTKLGALHIDSILLEGGATLNWSALQAGIVNRLQTYIAPKLFGGKAALSPIGGIGVSHPDQAIQLNNTTITALGDDLLLESEVVSDVHRNH